MPGFKVFRGADVPSASTLKRIRDVLELEPQQVSRAVELAVSQTRPGMYGAAELGMVAAELGLGPEVGVHAVNVVRFLAACLDRYDAADTDLVHDLRLAGLTEQEAERLLPVLAEIRPRAREVATRVRETDAAYEALPTITDFAAACDLRAVFQTRLGAEDVLGPESTATADDGNGVLAWVPIAVVTLETRDFAGERKATTFQAPLPILQNLLTALEKVRARLERTIEESGGRDSQQASDTEGR